MSVIAAPRLNRRVANVLRRLWEETSPISARRNAASKARLAGLFVVGILRPCGIQFPKYPGFLGIGQVTDRFVLDVPVTPLVFRRVVAKPLRMPADLVELPGPQPNRDVLDAMNALALDLAEELSDWISQQRPATAAPD